MTNDNALRETVRRRYAASAVAVSEGCCGPSTVDVTGDQYSTTELSSLPADAAAASLGCGNPTAVAELRQGETVLDLGSGGGIDVILSARRVGSTGFAYGLDMTDEMLELARRNAAEAAVENVEFLRGLIEQIPLADDAVDVVISNCVINLSVDKAAVFAEMARVLRPGGRIGITDIVADDSLSPEQRAERGSWVGCIAGALSVAEYTQGLAEAGFVDVSLTPTHEATDGLYSMIIRARTPD
ncbi:MAG TPA: arsenite methyltransferase [Acidimicrobiia bacterium]